MARSPVPAEPSAPAPVRARPAPGRARRSGDVELVGWMAVGVALASTAVLTWVEEGAGAGLGGLALADLIARSSVAPGWVAWALRLVALAGGALALSAPSRRRWVAAVRGLACGAGAVGLPLVVSPSRWGPGAAVAAAAMLAGAALGAAGLAARRRGVRR